MKKIIIMVLLLTSVTQFSLAGEAMCNNNKTAIKKIRIKQDIINSNNSLSIYVNNNSIDKKSESVVQFQGAINLTHSWIKKINAGTVIKIESCEDAPNLMRSGAFLFPINPNSGLVNSFYCYPRLNSESSNNFLLDKYGNPRVLQEDFKTCFGDLLEIVK